MKNPFVYPMRKSERVLGIIYIPIHAVLLPVIIELVFIALGLKIDAAFHLLICYTASFVFVLMIMFRFLRSSFSDMIDGFFRALQAVILGYALYWVLSWVTSIVLYSVLENIANPNDGVINKIVDQNRNVAFVVTVALAPIIEESIFRGALFGSIRQKSRLTAYVVSAIAFSVYHLWQFFITDFDMSLLLYALQYIPYSIALAWCYERGGTIWSPIVLHAAMNLMAISNQLGK